MKEAVTRAVEGPVSASLPASALQLHPRVRIFLDEEAASGLKNADYYRWIQADVERTLPIKKTTEAGTTVTAQQRGSCWGKVTTSKSSLQELQ